MTRARNSKGVYRKKTTEEFKEEMKDIYPNVEILGEYEGVREKIHLQCKKHGTEFHKTPSNMKRGFKNLCPDCKGEDQHKRQRKPNSVFLKELKDKHRGTIVAREEYVNTHAVIEFECLECETLFKTEPNAILRISGCPGCRTPKGELEIRQYLEDNGIGFEQHKTFKGCKDIHLLSYDFYLPKYNLLIEYDGKQHFEPIEFFGGETEFEKQVRRDTIKNRYAKENNIPLLRIPYTVEGLDIAEKVENKIISLRSKAEDPLPKKRVMI